MAEVRCHYCGKKVRLERARPRGGVRPGFSCPECFKSRTILAYAIAIPVGIFIFILILVLG